jgi:hypothetical protein
MFSAVAPDVCALSIATAISSPLATRWIESSTPRGVCCLLQCVKLCRCVLDVIGDKSRHLAKPWHCFDQDVLSFAVEVDREDADARCIAIGLRQRVHETILKHIA